MSVMSSLAVPQSLDAQSIDAWTRTLLALDLPVRRQTAARIHALLRHEDTVSARALADIMLTDPLMTARLYVTLYGIRGDRSPTQVTRLEGCIAMIGIDRLAESCRVMPILEDRLRGRPDAQRGLYNVIRRARQAAIYAWEIAVWRKDLEIEDIAIAALLHDLAEILVWCVAPDRMLEVLAARRSHQFRSLREAQRAVLKVELTELQLALARAWHLPELLVRMMDDHSGADPRTHNVFHAVNIARHSATGWASPELAHDYERLAAFLLTTPQRARALIERRDPFGPVVP